MRIFALIITLLLILPSSVGAAISIEIANPILSDSVITLDVYVAGLTTPQYLQGTLRRVGENNYFGFTENHQGNWFAYDGSPEPSYIQSTFYYFEPQEGSWSGKLRVKNNPDSKYYLGPGEYEIKLRRYTGNSDSATGDTSNILIVNLTESTPTPSPSPTPTPKPSPSSSSDSQEQPSLEEEKVNNSETSRSQSYSLTIYPSPSPEIAGASDSAEIDLTSFQIHPSPSPDPEESSEEKSRISFRRLLIPLSGLFILASVGLYLYCKNKSIPS